MKNLERLIEKTILYSRWVLVVFYLGLAAALVLYAYHFASELVVAYIKVFSHELEANQVLLKMLVLIDKALVASLIVMVMLSGYENFISRIDVDEGQEQLSWLGKLNPSSLKMKLASSIIAISSIHLLQVFLNIQEQQQQWHVIMQTIIYLVFVLGALGLGLLDKLSHSSHSDDEGDD